MQQFRLSATALRGLLNALLLHMPLVTSKLPVRCAPLTGKIEH